MRAADAFGAAGGAGGVEHRPAGAAVVRPSGFGRAEFGYRCEAVDLADRETRRGGQSRFVRGRDRRRGETVAGEERLGFAVLEDVGDLGAGEMPVHRDDVQPGLVGREVGGDRFDAVVHHADQNVAGFHAECAQAGGVSVGEGGQFPVGHLPAERIDHGDPVRFGVRDIPQTENFHWLLHGESWGGGADGAGEADTH